LPGQQFVQQHPQRVDIAARIHVQAAHLCLLRAHISRRADELLEGRKEGLVGQSTLRRLGDPEVDHLGNRHAVMQRHQDVRRLDVPMNNPLLVRMLDRPAHLDE
jgi:hypothetical protein